MLEFIPKSIVAGLAFAAMAVTFVVAPNGFEFIGRGALSSNCSRQAAQSGWET